MKRHTESAIREVHCVQRIAEQLHTSLSGSGLEGQVPTFLLAMCNGYFTTATGEGDLFQKFCQYGVLGQYTGRNVRYRSPSQADYSEARLRLLPFDHAFSHCTKDVQEREWIF